MQFEFVVAVEVAVSKETCLRAKRGGSLFACLNSSPNSLAILRAIPPRTCFSDYSFDRPTFPMLPLNMLFGPNRYQFGAQHVHSFSFSSEILPPDSFSTHSFPSVLPEQRRRATPPRHSEIGTA